MEDKPIVIKCPKCGQEYLPAEIFYANSFLGEPKNIVKTPSGAIDFFDGDSMNLEEQYVCDHCGAVLNIKAKVTFEVTIDDKKDFNKDYSVPLYTDRIKLKEPDLFKDDKEEK
jgi:predicted RNA-binding Zn-ribbon protein involved in translation (DUF1610 family)